MTIKFGSFWTCCKGEGRGRSPPVYIHLTAPTDALVHYLNISSTKPISQFFSKHAWKPFSDGEQARVLRELGYDYIFDNPFTIPDDK